MSFWEYMGCQNLFTALQRVGILVKKTGLFLLSTPLLMLVFKIKRTKIRYKCTKPESLRVGLCRVRIKGPLLNSHAPVVDSRPAFPPPGPWVSY